MSKFNIEKEIIKLVNELNNLPEIDKNNILMYAKNKEWGIALDTLSNQLYENNIRITSEVYEKIGEIGSQMQMPITAWDFLKELIK
jgi:uncharacterized protein YjgD (DUF1641 family)